MLQSRLLCNKKSDAIIMQKGMPKTKRLFQSRLLDDFRVKKIKFELSHNFPFLVLSCRIDVPQQKLDNN